MYNQCHLVKLFYIALLFRAGIKECCFKAALATFCIEWGAKAHKKSLFTLSRTKVRGN
ncbi:MAG: hypothetical protein JWQ09_3981 [Segetibacter sp.]|nr:hypothetical protein [Segetibacter sp.]